MVSDNVTDCPPELLPDWAGPALLGFTLPTPTCGRVAVYSYNTLKRLLEINEYLPNEAEEELRKMSETYRGTVAPLIVK